MCVVTHLKWRAKYCSRIHFKRNRLGHFDGSKNLHSCVSIYHGKFSISLRERDCVEDSVVVSRGGVIIIINPSRQHSKVLYRWGSREENTEKQE